MFNGPKHGVGTVRQILKTEGLSSLLRRFGRYIKWRCFVCITSNLYETTADDFKNLREADFMPKTENFILKIVSSNEEADKLEAEGFEFRSHDIRSRYFLDNGAIAWCIFVGNEFAHIAWAEMTKQLTDTEILKVDYSNNEVHSGWGWTDPKYRGLGFNRYTSFKRRQFVFDKGNTLYRTSIRTDNRASQASTMKITRKYAEARYLKIFGREFIKTTYVDGYKSPTSPLAWEH